MTRTNRTEDVLRQRAESAMERGVVVPLQPTQLLRLLDRAKHADALAASAESES